MAGHPVVGYVVWGAVFGALFAWEGIALAKGGVAAGYPTLSDTLRAVMHHQAGRWALFALWLWFGWHTFIRGWHFLLRNGQ